MKCRSVEDCDKLRVSQQRFWSPCYHCFCDGPLQAPWAGHFAAVTLVIEAAAAASSALIHWVAAVAHRMRQAALCAMTLEGSPLLQLLLAVALRMSGGCAVV